MTRPPLSTVVALATACATQDATAPVDTAAAASPSVAETLGITRYLGAAVIDAEVTESGVTTTTFDPDSGPRCLRGTPFQLATRDGSSDELVIFLQGGGACWSEFCLAVNQAPPGIPGVDVMRTDLVDNPVRNHDVVYLPYCDGSLFVGDKDHDDDGDGEIDRWHRGLANASAALDVAKARYPNPPRVVFAGSSGGGFGTLLLPGLVRHVYPDAELVILTDSGVGVGRGAADLDLLPTLVDEFGAADFLPPDCADCLDGGHLTPLVDWWLRTDPNTRIGVFTSWYDSILGDLFLAVPPAAYRDALASETGRTHAAFPDRYKRFVIDGRMHTTLLGNPTGIVGTDLSSVELPPEAVSKVAAIDIGKLAETEAEGVRFSEWMAGLIAGDERWVEVIEEAGEAPEVD